MPLHVLLAEEGCRKELVSAWSAIAELQTISAGQLGGQFAPETVDTTEFSQRKRWRKVQETISQVWRRWLQEYLPLLSRRSKWTHVVKDLKEDDVVLVLDPKLPRGQWPLGRIIETYPGRDGYTRVTKVQCGASNVVFTN